MTLITLADGRKLDIAVSGPTGGVPVVLHQTTPGAKVQYRVMQRAAHARGLRLVTFSRPGYGKSMRLARRAIVDIVADVEAVLDHLGADRSLQVGWSGGGPHALAAAAKLPDRVAGVATIAGVGPYGVAGLDFLAGMGEMNIPGAVAHLERGQGHMSIALGSIEQILDELAKTI